MTNNVSEEFTQENPVRAAVYIRVSGSRQDVEAVIEHQRAAAHTVIAERGYVLGSEYVDIAPPAPERLQLARLLNDAQKNAFNVVVAYSPDRLSRSVNHLADMLAFLEQWGVRVAFCQGDIDIPTLDQLAKLGTDEQQHAAAKAAHGRLVRALQDGDTGGPIPYGYQRVIAETTKPADRVVVVPEQAEVVKAIFGWSRSGLSYNQIAAILNEQEIASPAGGEWHRGTVRRLILNGQKYAGGKRGEAETCWPAIVDLSKPIESMVWPAHRSPDTAATSGVESEAGNE